MERMGALTRCWFPIAMGLLTVAVGTVSTSVQGQTAGQPQSSAELVSATDRQFWSFRRLTQPAVPALRSRARLRTPIDWFMQARLEEKGLALSPDADRFTLLRRAYFDLIGLPPSPEDIDAFLTDIRPDPYERLLDRLLASPHFGERWGRHWLDEAGYVDVPGGDNDAATVKPSPGKYFYRDYVIRSFNEDRPFERFLTEQLAGDELVDWRGVRSWTPEIQELLIATGFLRSAADDTDENELNTLDIRHGVLQRTGEVVASNLLALTLNCAKCHDHKYEPIPQRDYYRFLAIFAPAFNPQSWLQPGNRALPDISPVEKAEIDKHNAALDHQVKELHQRQAELRRPYEEKLFEAKLASVSEPVRADTRTALRTSAEKRNEVQKYLAGKFETILKVKAEEVTAALSETDRATLADLERQIAAANGRRRGWGTIQAVYDTGAPTSTHILRRGNYLAPGKEVQPGLLSVLCEPENAALLTQTKASGPSSGRRLELARRLTNWNTPAGALVARVRVNRLWQHLFGKGLVETSDNFGVTGTPPTHPELLEWLTAEFIRTEGQVKPLLKFMMTSSVYRQGSATSPGSAVQRLDPDNRLLGRMRLRRLESEVIRDALLAVSGKLDHRLGGPPMPVESRPDGTVVVKADNRWRRSIYLLARRNYHPTMLGVFDQPTVATNCPCRTPSAVVLQSLTMLNDDFVREQAQHLADRVAGATGAGNSERQVVLAFRMVLGRDPRTQETGWCLDLLNRQAERFRAGSLPAEQAARQALAHLCHVLLNTSEFLYVS